jgi:hypothetical protein
VYIARLQGGLWLCRRAQTYHPHPVRGDCARGSRHRCHEWCFASGCPRPSTETCSWGEVQLPMVEEREAWSESTYTLMTGMLAGGVKIEAKRETRT